MENTVSKARQFSWHRLDTQWQQFDPSCQARCHRTQQFAYGEELRQEQRGRIDADHLPGPGIRHAPAVISVTAADIQDQAVRQRLQMRNHPVPFPVRTPFGIDPDIGNPIRPLAPGMQGLQAGQQGRLRFALQWSVGTDAERALSAIHAPFTQHGQLIECLLPSGPVTMRRAIDEDRPAAVR